MASDINTITITGRLGRDAELKGNEGNVLTMRVGNNITVKDGGEWVEKANWFTVTMFGKRAQAVAPYLTKGTEVAISGELRQREYEGRDGSMKRDDEIIVDNLKLIGGYREGESSFPKPEAKPVSVYSDEIPF